MMDEYDDRDWPEKVRDELLPFAAFYGMGLVWLATVSTMQAWDASIARGILMLTAFFGLPVTALVTLMMIWRTLMVGIDSGKVVGMVVAASAGMAILAAAASLLFPALAIGHAIGEFQQAVIGSLG